MTYFSNTPRDGDDAMLATFMWGQRMRNPFGVAAGDHEKPQKLSQALQHGFGFAQWLADMREHKWSLARLNPFRSGARGFSFPWLEQRKQLLANIKNQSAQQGYVGLRVMAQGQRNQAETVLRALQGTTKPADMLVVDAGSFLSSNTQDGRKYAEDLLLGLHDGLRKFPADLAPRLMVALNTNSDERQSETTAELALLADADGIIVRRDMPKRRWFARQPVGEGMSLPSMVARMFRLTRKCIPIIGASQQATPDEAYAAIKAGARLVQMDGAIGSADNINQLTTGLRQRLERDGLRSVRDAVGADV